MRRAIGLARSHMGATWPNPTVGCVIAQGDEVVGEAVTAPGGRPHAEDLALSAAGSGANGATAYITLEPCAKRSSPGFSCTDLLIAAGVKRVVIACDDASPLAAGLGEKRLDDNAILVETGVLADEAAPLYAGYLHRLATGRPRVEASETGRGHDARFEPKPGESLLAALERHGGTGHTRLWVEPNGPLAKALSQAGLLEANPFEGV